MDDVAIDVRELRKSFGGRRALDDISLTVRRGEMVALLGASGSGKSTLLRLVSGIACADAGSNSQVKVLGNGVQVGGRIALDIRKTRSRVAFIFQQFNLVDRLPVMVNVLAGALHRMPMWRGLSRRYSRDELLRAHDALVRVGIEKCAWQRASTLSGGQQQRAAISRALVQGAEVILADEPIASLDPASSRRILELLSEVNREFGTTVLVSLHQVDFAFAFCPRTIALRAGRVVYDGPTAVLTQDRLQSLYGPDVAELYESAPAQVSAADAANRNPLGRLQPA
jgi:phosphonate transport system ATP-binding protein